MYRQTALVADVAASRGIVNLKSAALIFDRIDVLKTTEGKMDQITSKCLFPDATPPEIEWLIDSGIVSILDDPSEALLKEDNINGSAFANYRCAEMGHILLLGGNLREDHYKSLSNFTTRYAASKLANESDETRRVPISYDNRFRLDKLGATIPYPFTEEVSEKYGVATALILSKIDIPEDETPWEAILDFRSNKENVAAFYNLRKFAKCLSSNVGTAADMRDEIEHSLYLTEKALERAKIKYRTAIMETVVVTAVSILENLVKFKWSEMAKSAFALRKTREEFLAPEAKIAEDSLYYVIKANTTIGDAS